MRKIVKVEKDGENYRVTYDDKTVQTGNYPALKEVFDNFPTKDTHPSDELDETKKANPTKIVKVKPA